MATMVRIPVSLPKPLKDKLDALRGQGYTASGFIRHLLEDHFKQAPMASRKGR